MNQIFKTSDGSHSIQSEKYGVSYHSRYGAVQETQHVFIDAGLRLKAVVQSDISVLEIGFGTGLNAFMTLLEAEKRNLTIRYTTLEAYPLEAAIYHQLNFPEVLQAQAFENAFRKMHEGPWQEPLQLSDHFVFQKIRSRVEELVFEPAFDLIYYDAFAPNAQPEIWEEAVLEKMYQALLPGGVLTTYCAKGSVKRSLRSIGFRVEAIDGPPGKREMTRAFKEE